MRLAFFFITDGKILELSLGAAANRKGNKENDDGNNDECISFRQRTNTSRRQMSRGYENSQG